MYELENDDRSFFDHQQQEEQHRKEIEHLHDLFTLRQILKWPDAKERTLITAERLGLRKEFEQLLRTRYGD